MVLLHGAQHFVVDDVPFRVEAGSGASCRPAVLMLNVARFAKLRFVNDSDVPLRKVMISAPFPWLERLTGAHGEGLPRLRDFFGNHLASFSFAPSRQIVHLAEEILAPPVSMTGEVRTLHRNSRALDIMCLACVELCECAAEARPRPQLASRRRSERVRDYILANLHRSLTIEEIAAEVGASVSSVQRHFKEHFRMTVFEFIRRERLAQAHAALQREGVSIAEAAYAAGYNEPSNFSVAFKKIYGVSPKFRRR